MKTRLFGSLGPFPKERAQNSGSNGGPQTSKFLNGTPVMPLQRYRFDDIFEPKKRGTTPTTNFPVARGGPEKANPVRMAIVSWTGVQKTLNFMLSEKNKNGLKLVPT